MKNDLMKQPSGNNKLIKNIGFGLIVVSLIAIGFVSYSKPQTMERKVLSEVIDRANNGEIEKLTIVGDKVEVSRQDRCSGPTASR